MKRIKFTERRAFITDDEGVVETWTVNKPIPNDDEQKNLQFFAYAGITYYFI